MMITHCNLPTETGIVAARREALSHRNRDHGFSLLELTIALGVLAVVMFSLMSMVVISSATLQSAREQETAKEAVAGQIAKIRMSGFGSVPGFQGTTFVVDGLSDPQQADGTARGTVAIDTSNTALLGIQVTVSWKGRKGKTFYSMRSLCAL